MDARDIDDQGFDPQTEGVGWCSSHRFMSLGSETLQSRALIIPCYAVEANGVMMVRTNPFSIPKIGLHLVRPVSTSNFA